VRDFDYRASFRVPPRARLAMSIREGTEAAYLDPSTPSECGGDLLEDGFDNALHIAIS